MTKRHSGKCGSFKQQQAVSLEKQLEFTAAAGRCHPFFFLNKNQRECQCQNNEMTSSPCISKLLLLHPLAQSLGPEPCKEAMGEVGRGNRGLPRVQPWPVMPLQYVIEPVPKVPVECKLDLDQAYCKSVKDRGSYSLVKSSLTAKGWFYCGIINTN